MASCGSQFSTGDQGNAKEAFWRSGMKQCQNISCSRDDPKENTIRSVDHPAGCRMNGDGYGTTVFSCYQCGWKTSFQYDDASEPYYYETRDYRNKPINNKSKPPHPWASIRIEDWYIKYNIDPRIRSKLRSYAISIEDMSEMSQKQLNALGLKREEAQSIMKEIARTNHDLMTGAFYLERMDTSPQATSSRVTRNNSF